MQPEPLKFKEPHLALAGMTKIDLIHALDADRSRLHQGSMVVMIFRLMLTKILRSDDMR